MPFGLWGQILLVSARLTPGPNQEALSPLSSLPQTLSQRLGMVLFLGYTCLSPASLFKEELPQPCALITILVHLSLPCVVLSL